MCSLGYLINITILFTDNITNTMLGLTIWSSVIRNFTIQLKTGNEKPLTSCSDFFGKHSFPFVT